MLENFKNEPVLEIYIHETLQFLEQLELILIKSEQAEGFDQSAINEIFRIMHTIKGSSAMMMFENIAVLSHAIEDLFYFLRTTMTDVKNSSEVTDVVLNSLDFMKVEVDKIQAGHEPDGDSSPYVNTAKDLLRALNSIQSQPVTTTETKNIEEDQKDTKFYIGYERSENTKKNCYKAKIFFEKDCEMENIRAFMVINNSKDVCDQITHIPEDIINDSTASDFIRTNGFQLNLKTDLEYEDIKNILNQTAFIKTLELEQITDENLFENKAIKVPVKNIYNEIKGFEAPTNVPKNTETSNKLPNAGMISVGVRKLDLLVDLVGELVISGSMLIENPNLKDAELENFRKFSMQHKKIIGELQDAAMSLRMVPISATFNKMIRIVRDMNKKLGKDIDLEILGGDTEIDKNIVESISDPLMHLVRNAADHGIETAEERIALNKKTNGTITLDAKNVGGEVWIIVKDDGKGLDKEKIYKKASESGILSKSEAEMTGNEVFSLIFKPGFSTKESVSEFSGRGVGLDVVNKNIGSIGGNIVISSKKGIGTTFTVKIPLTLAIIGGMTVKIRDSKYTIPITAVRECFRPHEKDLVTDPSGNEMIMIRGICYPIIRLHEKFSIKTNVTSLTEGILIMAESENSMFCLFADELLGEQQVVLKTLPSWISKRPSGISGCTLLGDGSISLILDLDNFVKHSATGRNEI